MWLVKLLRSSCFPSWLQSSPPTKLLPRSGGDGWCKPNWWSLTLDNLFLAGQIHYILTDISAFHKPDALHGCSQDPKSRNPETETLYLQDRDETETLNPRDRDETFQKRLETASRPRRPRPRLQPWCWVVCSFYMPYMITAAVWIKIYQMTLREREF